MYKKIFILFGLLIISTVVISSQFFMRSTERQPEKITVAIFGQPYLAILFIAEEKGFLEEEGVEVTFKRFPAGKDALRDTLSGKSDLAVVGQTPVIQATYEGKKVGVVTTLFSSTKNMAIVGRKDHGIYTIEDIRGKVVAARSGTIAEYFLFSYLTSQGIDLSEIELADANQKEMKELLEKEEVDAVAVGNPYLWQIQESFPENSLAIIKSNVYMSTALLVGERENVVRRREAVIRLLRGMKKAERFIAKNDKDSLRVVQSSLSDVDARSIQATWHDFTPEMKLNNVLLNNMVREAQWYRTNGMYSRQVPNIRKILMIEYLKEVDPEAVTLF